MSFYSLSEQLVTVGILIGFMVGLAGAGFCAVLACDKAQRWLAGERTIPKAQRDRIGRWKLRMIGEGRMDARTACMVIPSEADLLASEAALLHEAEEAKREIAASKEGEGLVSPAEKQGSEIAPASPPMTSEPSKVSPLRTREQTPVAAPPRVIIEMVADPKFKVNLGTVSDAFREVVADHCEVLRELVADCQFGQVIGHFRREEQRTHSSVRCACFVVNALFDGLKGVQVTSQLVGRITPERGKSDETVYRNTFFAQDFGGANRRPLQTSDLTPAKPIESAPVLADEEFAYDFNPEEFKAYFESFERTRAFLMGLPEGTTPPPLNSKAQTDLYRRIRGEENGDQPPPG
jgi:hypothetical protein